jgi:hypothetical protein
MANAINQNLEKMDILQVTENRLQHLRDDTNNTGQPQRQERYKQGETIKTDLLVQGSKIYTDAAWKTRKPPGSNGRIATGIGVFCHLEDQASRTTKVLIQAASPTSPSPLHAEEKALIFVAQIAEQLEVDQVTFLTYSLILAKAAAAKMITDTQVPWELREQIAHYKRRSRNLQHKIYHIKRDINGVAHNCAHQALRQSLSMPTYSCSNSAHVRDNCPLLLAFQNIYLQ